MGIKSHLYAFRDEEFDSMHAYRDAPTTKQSQHPEETTMLVVMVLLLLIITVK